LLVLKGVSHPLDEIASQSRSWGLHVNRQLPVVHAMLVVVSLSAWLVGVQSCWQVPQFFMSVATSVSQLTPFAGGVGTLPTQCWCVCPVSTAHAKLHCPSAQLAETKAPARVVQSLSQEPQLRASSNFLHWPAQHPSPGTHGAPVPHLHSPPTHAFAV